MQLLASFDDDYFKLYYDEMNSSYSLIDEYDYRVDGETNIYNEYSHANFSQMIKDVKNKIKAHREALISSGKVKIGNIELLGFTAKLNATIDAGIMMHLTRLNLNKSKVIEKALLEYFKNN